MTNFQVGCDASTTYSPGRTFSKVKLPLAADDAFFIASEVPFFFKVKVTPNGPSALPLLITCDRNKLCMAYPASFSCVIYS